MHAFGIHVCIIHHRCGYMHFVKKAIMLHVKLTMEQRLKTSYSIIVIFQRRKLLLVRVLFESFCQICVKSMSFRVWRYISEFEGIWMVSSVQIFCAWLPWSSGTPCSLIIHYLERQARAKKFDEANIKGNPQDGTFTTIKQVKENHVVDFVVHSSEPSCTCKDWKKWKIPCKHFFAVFNTKPQ